MKLIFRLIAFAVLAVAVFIIISLSRGGEPFRWFGKKVEEESRKVSEEADKLRDKSDQVMKGIKETKEKINDLTGRKSEGSR